MKQEPILKSPQDKIFACRYCQRKVDKLHIAIHQIRCVAKLNFARRMQQSQNHLRFSPILMDQQQEQKIEPPKGIKMTVKGNSKKKQTSFRFTPDPQSKIPCNFCGHQQQLFELDTHPSECLFRDILCQDCQDSFPLALMEEHKQVCPNQRQEQRINFRIERFIEPEYSNEQESEMQQSQVQSSIILQNRLPQRRRALPNPHRYFQSSPGVFQRISGNRGQLRNEQRFQRWRRGPIRLEVEQRVHQQQQQQEEDGQTRLINLAEQFMNLINLLAQRQQEKEEGLNQEEIKQLKKQKYVQTDKTQKDLCTICYCDLQEPQTVVKLKCNHIYHPQCIVKWLQKNKKCPVCKCKQTDRQDEESEA